MNKARARSAKTCRRNIVGTPLKGNIAQAQDQQLNQLLAVAFLFHHQAAIVVLLI
jgi:hypothetical protein